MRRFVHYLRENAKSETTSQFICVDTETKPESLPDGRERDHLWFGWASYQRSRLSGVWCEPEWFRFETREEFWKWTISKARKGTLLYVFCHNTSFDLPVLGAFTVTKRLGLKLKRAIIDAPPTMLKWETGKASIKLLDTLNLWRMPLAKIGEMIGCPKGKMPDPDASRETWDAYCKQDVEIIRRVLIGWWAFLRDSDMGNFRPTLASQAMGSYKHRAMDYKILVHDNRDALVVERAAYHGGRCDCFRVGKWNGEYSLLDVTSMYPYVMRERDYPVRFLWLDRPAGADKLRRALDHHLVVADVTIRTDTPVYPLVRDNKLVFPTGRFRTCLTTEELKYAMERGDVDECHAISEYAGAPCFTRFIDLFWGLRSQAISAGNVPLAWNYKILMNSLYGKFGQAGRVWDGLEDTYDESARAWTEVDVPTGKVVKKRQLAGLVQSFTQEPESAESCPAIAAHVCANARMYLWKLIETAGREHVLYCDTDSLLVDREGKENLASFIAPGRLGGLKVEGEYDEVEIWGPKDYRFGDKVRHKGIRKQATQTGESQWEQWQWSSLVGLIRSGQIDAPSRIKVRKTLSRRYTKGLIDESRFVRPLVISE